jgi:hypothetical protein
MGKKGFRSTEGQGEIWNEPKTVVVSVKLTPTGKRLLDEKANSYGISKGELIERIARGSTELPMVTPTNQAPNLNTVLDTLSRYSRSQLAQVAWTAISLLIGAPNTFPNNFSDKHEEDK